MVGALIAGGVAIVCALVAFGGVLYTARTQKEPTIIRVGQEVAADAIATLMRERDEARAESAVKTTVIAELNEQLTEARAERDGMRDRLVAEGVRTRRHERDTPALIEAIVDVVSEEINVDEVDGNTEIVEFEREFDDDNGSC